MTPGRNFLDSMDFIANQILLPLGGMMIAIFVGWFVKKDLIINEVGYVKGFYVKEKLKLVWISALGSVFESDYGDVLKAIRDSFQLLS